jgi:Abnormal spindle-like microcephaly-assoc'd, ASPM-SPD-2-Hydin/NHL repeat
LGMVYVADTANHTIRTITPTGVVSTLAGLAGNSGSADGTNSVARFFYPDGLVVDALLNVYVADTANHTLRQISPAGAVTTLAGLAGNSGSSGGPADAARFNYPSGVAVNAAGNLFVADSSNDTIREGIFSSSRLPTRIIGLLGDLSCGNVLVGQTATRTLTITNSGDAPLNVSGINYPAGFSGAWSGSIPPGAFTNVTVTFAPNAASAYSGLVTVTSDATAGINVISASGTGIPLPTRTIGLSGSLNFGPVQVGYTASRTLTLTNSGNSPLTISNINYPAGFSGAWSGSIPPSSSQNVTVTFTPSVVADYSGNLSVTSDATAGTSIIAVSGAGIQVLSMQLTGMSFSNGLAGFVLHGPVGNSYVIQTSSNLLSWLPFSTNVIPVGGFLTVVDPTATNDPIRFYRAVPNVAANLINIAATSGVVTGPFVISNAFIYQPTETGVANGGRAAYDFTVAAAGNYLIRALVDAPNEGANSFFLNIDAEPLDPYMTWDIEPITFGFDQRPVSWRGNGTFDHNQFVPVVFNLTSGAHQLIIRGREAYTLLQSVTVLPYP